MKDKDKAQGQLMEELKHLRKRVAELESTDAKRKQADEEVHGKEQLFRALVDRSSDIIVLVNREGKIIYENPVIEQAIGLKPEESLGASIFERIHPDDMKTVTNAFTKLWQDPDAVAQKAEIRLRHKDGKWRTFEATGTNLVHDSAIEAVIVNLRDVTDRKKADEDLRKSEERFRALIESSLDVITIVDAQGTVLYQSPNYASVWGRDPSGEVGKDMFKDVHPDDIPLVGDAFVRLLKKPSEPVQLQVRALHTNGTWHTIDVVARNQIENPAVRGIVVNFRDVTERRRAEEQFRTLFEGSSNPITVYDRDGNCLMVNPKGAKNLGLPVGEIVGKSARVFFPELFEDLVKRFRKVIDQGETLQFEDMVKISTGDAWFWSTLEPVRDATGVPYAVQIISYDITERKRMEQVLRGSEEKFRMAFDNANTGMCLVGLSGNLMKVNDKMSEIFGYSREELERMTVTDIAHPEDRDVSYRHAKGYRW